MTHFFVHPNFIEYVKTDFTVGIRRTFVIILSLEIQPHLKCVASRYTIPCEISVLQATIVYNMISVTTHFKKLTIGNNVFIVSVIT